MNYLHQPITGLLLKITQLFSGRVNYKFSSSSGLDEFQIPVPRQAVNVVGNAI